MGSYLFSKQLSFQNCFIVFVRQVKRPHCGSGVVKIHPGQPLCFPDANVDRNSKGRKATLISASLMIKCLISLARWKMEV